MQTYSAQFGIRVRRHTDGPLDRPLSDTFHIHDCNTEEYLRQRIGEVMDMRLNSIGDTCGIKPTAEQMALVHRAVDRILGALDRAQPVGKPYQFVFECDDGHGSVEARLWTNVTMIANRPYRVHLECS